MSEEVKGRNRNHGGKGQQKLFYHVADREKLESIIKEGLKPDYSEDGVVFLWDDLDYALDMLGYRHDNPCLLEVTIPESWVKIDDKYYDSEANYGHAFKCKRIITRDRIEVLDWRLG